MVLMMLYTDPCCGFGECKLSIYGKSKAERLIGRCTDLLVKYLQVRLFSMPIRGFAVAYEIPGAPADHHVDRTCAKSKLMDHPG